MAGRDRKGAERRYEDLDDSSFDRPRRRTRPRTKDRPTYDDATDAVVMTVDRGRYTCGAGRRAAPAGDGHEVAAAGPQGRRRRRPGAPGG